MSEKKKFDFAGWVTKNDIRCADGVVIKHGAFKDNDQMTVPLVWNHNSSIPSNVLGHMILHNKPEGVYGYGFFNESEYAETAKGLVHHGDISAMSIAANKLKKMGQDVIHGMIYEVSLVLAGANPGALIEDIIKHSDNGEELTTDRAIIHTAIELEHAEEGEIEIGGKPDMATEKTIGDVMETMNEEQTQAVEALLAATIAGYEDEEEEVIEQSLTDEEELRHNQEGGDPMKKNVFDQGVKNELTTEDGTVITHDLLGTVLKDAEKGGSLKESMIQHGINSIDMLFPEADMSTNGNTPIIYRDPNTQYDKILSGVTKSPFAKVRTLIADLTEDEARAKGYIKGAFKKEEFYSLIKRKTAPGTIYKKQKLDRDDIIDITDFDVVQFMSHEMRFMLEEEIARAILVGDGREIDDEDKIDETTIRPIVTDNEFFTIQANYTNAAGFLEAVILAMADYRGSGLPTMYINHTLLSQVKLLKGTDGRYLTGSIPSNADLATQMGIGSIVPTSLMSAGQAVVVNLRDYQVGSSKGGQITNFDDFDIDYNQYKYLIETRLSGALTLPKSAINFSAGTVTGATQTTAGMSYGERQADKPVVTPEAI